MPHELSAFGVFFSPWLAAWAGACLLAPVTSGLLSLCGLDWSFRSRQWTFLAMLAAYACALFRWGL